MTGKFVTGVIAFGLASSVAANPAISAGEFLSRAEPLMNKSEVTLLFSSEARNLMKIIREAGKQVRMRADSDRAAGRPVTTCLPAKGKASINAAELIKYLRALPAAQKAQSFNAAFGGYLARKYPCR